MKNQDKSAETPKASRRGFLVGLLAGAGATAAVATAKTAKAQAAKPAKSGPVLFHRTAETERYYKSVLVK
jgi:Rieske Fe-S protein